MRDAQMLPRYADVATFMRSDYRTELDDDVDIAFLGIPWDSDSTWNSGARWGPRAIRDASTYLKPYNPETDTDLRDVEIVDAGDLSTIPGYTVETLEVVEEEMREVLGNDLRPAYVSNDAMPLAVVRALADEHGPLSLVHWDAHSDLWTEYFGQEYNHGTWVHHALEEGLIDPETSIRIGDRGGLYDPGDLDRFEASGIEYYTTTEAKEVGADALADRIREVADGPVYSHLDLDVFDSAYAVGVSGPEPFGLEPFEVRTMIRALHDLDVVTSAVVECCPPHDPTGNTAILGANVLYEMVCAMAD